MANMSYCRFQNTLEDLRDCYEEMNQYLDIYTMELSEEEMKAMKALIKLCRKIADENE
jgi:transposase